MKTLKAYRIRLAAGLCVLCLTAAGCNPVTSPPDSGPQPPQGEPPQGKTELGRYAEQALGDLYETWWSPVTDTIWPLHNGYFASATDNMPWATATMMSAIYTQWLMNGRLGPEDVVSFHSFNRQWEFTVENLGDLLTGNCGLGVPSPAVDDSGWNAMYYMMTHNVTQNEAALDAAQEMILNTFAAFKAAPPGAEDDTQNRGGANGLWYSYRPPSLGFAKADANENDNRWKSLYAAGVVSAALEFLLLMRETDPHWRETHSALWEDVLGAYEWMEGHLLRASAETVDKAGTSGSPVTLPKTFTGGLQSGLDYTMRESIADNLYWADYNENRTGRGGVWSELPDERYGPSGGARSELWIREASSFSFLGGNMAMAVCHARLYRLTGDETYLNRAVRTVWALTESPNYNRNGVLLNDRDAWANGFFAGMYAEEVLTLPGIRDADIQLLINTGKAAYENCRFILTPDMDILYADSRMYRNKVFYRAEWSGGNAWTLNAGSPTQPTQVMTSGTTVSIIMAAAYAEQLLAEGKTNIQN